MRMVIPPSPGDAEMLLSFHYVDDIVYLFDNRILGWSVDPIEDVPPAPRIIGSLPSAVDTAPIQSPQWCTYGTNGVAYAPDIFRGRLPDLLVFLATNNDAGRRVNGDGLTQSFAILEYEHFSAMHPELV
jgi:hypothetical protein